MTDIENHVNQLKEAFGSKLVMVEIVSPTRMRLRIHADDLDEIMQFIASELKFTTLDAISGVDYETYFEVVYHLDRWDGDATVIQVHVKIEDR
ncbi:MAG: NADH-quinone oxidoreductase subunit C, partial [Candidatus Hodarchaeota archaeon]